ncbi:TPA: DUF4442 domain-containing protein [Legionella pneumophila]|uniref:DUF4442 domain-containing protein n=1 Tax=Legionella pneumophila TaxID=446 RepID=A0A2S6F5M8_LEGPN|nr:DUF4442 domain-containing protein [Legionella pneumophila]APF02236.1 hypothetical protein BIZ52_02185 [Legionella pneumophila subsp. fraseri]APF05246.1 hypothetical protein BIZ51_02185 [Legionella pneumophila subsp. fraseri]AUB67719.1 hypothetical protein BJK09_02190 [Legionella pneumophila]AUB70690.1 hypothetical protein BJK08_02190 [Legionella pneumophila]KXB27179.1 hypothetical protein PtVF66_03550 [Legionella pneumophila]
MSPLTQFKFFLWFFSHFKVALIGYLKPKLIQLTDNEIVVRLPLTRRSRNHLHSMYFGALAVGADIAGGLHGFYHAKQAKCKVSLAFKAFQAQFLRRPESDVYFICTEGEVVKKMIEESKKSGERINKPIHITAYINYLSHPEEIADFILELSVKVLK